ncbi:hypothetical protein ikelab_11810 [Lactococcus garvieae]|uniref:Uncharacterized protein n=1 Tax=Lactococcus garvieae TaxID=1363 RepID=A0A6L2ZVS8_9LACT|nr:hypothetical protein ikelab_11810 [Lactococcus garvieae]
MIWVKVNVDHKLQILIKLNCKALFGVLFLTKVRGGLLLVSKYIGEKIVLPVNMHSYGLKRIELQ